MSDQTKRATCHWKQWEWESDTWEPECRGNSGLFCFEGDGPDGEGFAYCPFCGMTLVEVPFVDLVESEDEE